MVGGKRLDYLIDKDSSRTLDLPYPGSNFNLDLSDFANLNHVCISNGVFCEVTYDEHKVGYRKKESAHSVNPNA